MSSEIDKTAACLQVAQRIEGKTERRSNQHAEYFNAESVTQGWWADGLISSLTSGWGWEQFQYPTHKLS